MSMAEDYIQAHKAMCKVVEESFRKMSKYCRFSEPAPGYVNRKLCLYNGRTDNHVCAREICPILEEE